MRVEEMRTDSLGFRMIDPERELIWYYKTEGDSPALLRHSPIYNEYGFYYLIGSSAKPKFTGPTVQSCILAALQHGRSVYAGSEKEFLIHWAQREAVPITGSRVRRR